MIAGSHQHHLMEIFEAEEKSHEHNGRRDAGTIPVPGEVEWLQVMHRDLVWGDVDTKNYHKNLSPFLAILPEKCQLAANRQPQCALTDANHSYDSIFKQCPSSRQDRRNALELAVVIDVGPEVWFAGEVDTASENAGGYADQGGRNNVKWSPSTLDQVGIPANRQRR